MTRRILLVLLVMLSLPILLPVYKPSLQLEGLGVILGTVAITISPILLFGSFLYVVAWLW